MAYKVAIDAGHGGSNSTPGKRTPAGEYEWIFNNTVVNAAIAKMKDYGITVLRTDDASGKTDVPLSTRTNKANSWGADAYVSVHHNANTGKWGDWTGVETYTYTGSNLKSEKLAKAVHPRIVSAMGLRDRGTKKANLHIVRETKMAAILTEGGYMDSNIDIKKMRDNAVLRKQGEAIADGVAEFFGIKVKASSASAVKTETAAPTKTASTTTKAPASGGGSSYVKAAQNFANSRNYPTKAKFAKLDVDGFVGPKTKNALLRIYQYFAGVTIDGIFGAKSKAAGTLQSRKSHSKWWTHLIQATLVYHGAKIDIDGAFGPVTETAVKSFQKANGLTADGIVGPNTYEKLFK